MRKLILICLMSVSLGCFADVLQLGQQISPFKLANQHGKLITVDDKAKVILFTKEKAPSVLLNNFLLKQSKDFLAKNSAFYIADISGMPFLISKIIALPKMRKQPFDILLAKNETTLAFVPHKEDFITVIKRKEGKITAINFVNLMDVLEKSFK